MGSQPCRRPDLTPTLDDRGWQRGPIGVTRDAQRPWMRTPRKLLACSRRARSPIVCGKAIGQGMAF